MNSEVFQVGELTAAIGDNSADDDHRAGVAGLLHRLSLRRSPACAGELLQPAPALPRHGPGGHRRAAVELPHRPVAVWHLARPERR